MNSRLLGISSAMRNIESMLPRLAAETATVLITGESGTGKDVVAHALHRACDPGGCMPFVTVNCSGWNERLLEAELFGHVSGASVEAMRRKKGCLEQADGGTLVLAEVGDMPLATQINVLRAMQDGMVMPAGCESMIPINIRVICTTHRNLKKMVDVGEFLQALYERIHVVDLPIPPLRERKEDILWLAGRLLETETSWHVGGRRSLSAAAKKALVDYAWPGNVHELKNCLERACILSNKLVLPADLLFEYSVHREHQNTYGSLRDYMLDCERRYIDEALKANSGRISESAAVLGISRKNLWEKMKRLHMHSLY